MKSNVVLALNCSVNKLLGRIPSGTRGKKILFLSRDYLLYEDIKKRLHDPEELIEFKKKLSTIANRLRPQYIEFIGRTGSKLNSFEWWTGRIAEKNTFCSPVFLYACYFELCRDYIEEARQGDSDLYVISESDALLRMVHDQLNKTGAVNIERIKTIMEPFKSWISRYRNWIRLPLFLHSQLWKLVIVKLKLKKHVISKEKEYIFIRTWASRSSIVNGELFRDAYFEDLSNWLNKLGFNAVTVPIIYNSKVSFADDVEWYAKSRESFVLLHEYCTVIDIARITARFISQNLLIRRFRYIMNGLDHSELFKEEADKTAMDAGLMEFGLYYYFVRNIAKTGARVRTFILTFENMVHEKALLMGLNRFMPSTRSVGCQHTVIYPLLLSQYIGKDEKKYIPLPSKIVCTGEAFRKILIRENFPEERVFVGPAMRYTCMYKMLEGQKKPSLRNAKLQMIVAGVENSQITSELLKVLDDALRDEDKVSIVFKPHPNMSMRAVDLLSEMKLFSSGKAVVREEKLNLLLEEADCFAGCSTGALFDAIMCGVPVIRFKRTLDVAIDPVEWFEDEVRTWIAFGAADIRDNVRQIAELTDVERNALQTQGRSLLKKCFNSKYLDDGKTINDRLMRVLCD